jgi:hypothetical protein
MSSTEVPATKILAAQAAVGNFFPNLEALLAVFQEYVRDPGVTGGMPGS